jgi:hypothetical protein
MAPYETSHCNKTADGSVTTRAECLESRRLFQLGRFSPVGHSERCRDENTL